MYYHCRELKYVQYGKVFPPPVSSIDDYMLTCYKWLGKYCGFCPQVWLSRSKSNITGFRSLLKAKKCMFSPRRHNNSSILFGFDVIKGFPVDYELWCFLMNAFFDEKMDIKRLFDEVIKSSIEDGYDPMEEEYIRNWKNSSSEEDYVKKYLFVKHDQVVVPSLNLKAAKQIICRNEKDFKALRKMGFIKDRISIRNDRFWGII